MSKSTDEPQHEEIPPLVVGTRVFDDSIVLGVIIDEEMSTTHLHHRIDAFPAGQPHWRSLAPMEVDFNGRKSRKTVWRCMAFGTALVVMVVVLALLATAATHFSRVYLSMQPVSIIELCSISSSALPWESNMVVSIGHLDFVSMNNESLVGMQGQTMMETHSLVTGRVYVQYEDTNVQSLTLTHAGILVRRENDHVVMLSNKDGEMWRSIHDYTMDATILDSDGKNLVLWLLNDVYVVVEKSLERITSLEGVTSIKMTQDGNYIFVATDAEVQCFRNDDGRWTAQQSLWRKKDDAGYGRKALESHDQTHTELDVSSDGSLVALRGSTLQVLFFTFFRQRRKKLGGGGRMDATHISVSSNGRRAAVALKSGTVLIYEREDYVMNVVGEIQSQNVTLMNFQENRLQIVDGENMTRYENKCDTILND